MPEFNGFDPALAAERASETPPETRDDNKAKAFRGKTGKGSPLSADQAKRQGQVSQIAFLALGQKDAIAFLNGHDEELGGRPLDLAIQSAEGLAAVEHRLKARAQVS